MEDIKERDVVLCTVNRIEKTTVFVTIDGNGEGTIVISEIAPGRIRNIREYVVPNKKIVCKVLKIDSSGNIHLSLRRVYAKEKKEVVDKYEREKTSSSILKSILKEKAEETIKNIRKKEPSLFDFLQACKTQPEKLKEFLTEEEAKKTCKILKEKKEKHVEVKKEFSLTSNLPNGMSIIKTIILPFKENITYLAAGRYLIKIKAKDYKQANYEIQKILQDIEAKAKQENCKYEAKEK